ncbi:hypothetical protein Tco_0687534 [Tanacetum coccineum]
MDTSEKLMPNNGQTVSQLECSRVIGCLIYAMTCTRPNIAFAVGKQSKSNSNPGAQHWQAIQWVLKYLKKTMDYKLTYIGYPSVLEGYTDASWISNSEDSGWVFLLDGATGKEAEWLKNLLLEIPLWVKPIAPISIQYDIAATLAKAYIQMYNGKSRHLGVRHNMFRELTSNGVISIEFMDYAVVVHGSAVTLRQSYRSSRYTQGEEGWYNIVERTLLYSSHIDTEWIGCELKCMSRWGSEELGGLGVASQSGGSWLRRDVCNDMVHACGKGCGFVRLWRGYAFGRDRVGRRAMRSSMVGMGSSIICGICHMGVVVVGWGLGAGEKMVI